ncbi:MAG: c-type cytochrome [Chloroflexota bacterium]|nr:c-type cytochrome [Chloroflexota bacterium]
MHRNKSHTHYFRITGVLLVVLMLLLIAAATVSAQEGDITRGSQIFDADCAVCHGPDGQGRAGSDLSDPFPALFPEAFVHEVVANGVTGTTMPAWSQEKGGPLTDGEIDDVAAFVNSLSGGRSELAPTATPFPVTPVPTVPGASGDSGHGQALFMQNCTMCHGEQGQGRVGSSLSKTFSSINPQQFLRATVATGILGTAMPGWSQEKGGPLTDQDIDDISAYIVAISQSSVPTESAPQQGDTTSGLLVILGLILIGVLLVLLLRFASNRNSTES